MSPQLIWQSFHNETLVTMEHLVFKSKYTECKENSIFPMILSVFNGMSHPPRDFSILLIIVIQGFITGKYCIML